jgi:hypothetical protein
MEALLARKDILLASSSLGGEWRQTDISVPAVLCGGRMPAIETALTQLPGLRQRKARREATTTPGATGRPAPEGAR